MAVFRSAYCFPYISDALTGKGWFYLAFRPILPSRFTAENKHGSNPGIDAAGDVRIYTVSDQHGFISCRAFFRHGELSDGRFGFTDEIGFSFCRVIDHLADGSAVRHITVSRRAHPIRVGRHIHDFRIQRQQAAGIIQLLIGQFGIVTKGIADPFSV